MEKLVKQAISRYRRKVAGPLPKNLTLQVISLFFALFLWYFVVGEDKIDMTIYVPLEITNLEQDLVISNSSKDSLKSRSTVRADWSAALLTSKSADQSILPITGPAAT